MAEPRTPGPVGLHPKPAPRPAAPASPTKKPLPGPIGVGTKKAAPPSAPAGANVGAQIVAFANSRSGQRVGDGQCFALADQALKSAGSKSAADFGTVTAHADYKWGSQVSLATVAAGDIVQFRNFRTTRRDSAADGGFQEFTHGRPHHTAIVASVDGNGLLTVFEQNAPEENSPVHKTQLGFSNTSFVNGETTVTIKISGTVWFYRPQPK